MAIESSQTRQIYSASTASLITSTLLAVILAFLQRNVIDPAIVSVWLSVLVLVMLARFALIIAYKRTTENVDLTAHVWRTRFRIGVLLSGLVWGSSSFLLFPPDNPPYQMFLLFILSGLTAGGVISYSADLRSGLTFSIVVLISIITRLFLTGDSLSIAMGMAGMLYLGFMILSLRLINRNMIDNIQLRLEATAREKLVKISEERYRLLLSHSPVGIFHYDTNLVITYCNDYLADILHSTVERLIGLDMKQLQDKSILPALKSALNGEMISYEGYYMASFSVANGWMSMACAPSRDDSDRIIGGIAIVQDITVRRKMEHSLQQQLRFTGTLNKIARSIVEQENPESILNDTAHTIGEALTADRALIYDICFDKHQAIALSEWLNPQFPDITSTKATYPLAIFIDAATELQRTHQWLTSHTNNINPYLQHDGSGALLHDQMQIRSLLWYPFSFRKNGYFLLVINQIHSYREWAKEEIEFLDSASQQVSVALEKISLMEQRKQVENDLRIAATAFESQEGMLITNSDNKILRVNRAFTEITGYTAEEIIGKNPNLMSSERQDSEFYDAMWHQINTTGNWDGEIWNKRKNGDIYPEHLTITAVKDAHGTVMNYVATFNDISVSKAAANEIKHLAFYDPLTHLPNRRLLLDRLQQSLATSARSGSSGSLLFIDLDNFKTLNDTLGHDIGDLLLQHVAERLTLCVREGDTVARLGGDEFVVMLEDLSSHPLEAAAQTETIGHKILDTLNLPYQLDSHEYFNSPSIGATLFSGHQLGIDELFKQADIAMYQAKKSGRNTLRFFDPEMQDSINHRVELEAELRNALENQEFQLHYQIQIDNLHQPLGAEVLIRWLHPKRGLISPFHFIPLAEETGLILPLGSWVLDMACVTLCRWQQSPATRDLVLAVNVSSRQFRQPDFVTQVQTIVQRHAINPNRLKLELTESLLLDNIEDTIATMTRLRQIGIQFSLDDFGTGYSSLQYLKRLPLDQLKIDQSFIRDIVDDDSDKAIVHTIIAMSQSLNLDVIAEGVETEQQRLLLQEKGCMHYQGYLFGRPVPLEQFEATLTGSIEN